MFQFGDCGPVFHDKAEHEYTVLGKTSFAHLVVLVGLWTTVEEFKVFMKILTSCFFKQSLLGSLFISSYLCQ